MKVKVNGTEAKDIALYFLDAIGADRYTQVIVGRTIRQVKSVMASGYTKEEIINVIDYLLNKGTNMYSFGYISASINDVLGQIEKEGNKDKFREEKDRLKKHMESKRKALSERDESSKRNKKKIERFGVQSRFREKFDFDMFEE